MAVTVYAQRRVIGTNRYDYDLKGLSTDPKPSQIYGIDIVENSLFLEMDTGDFYYLKSQGSTSRETLIEEQSFTGNEGEVPDAYSYEFSGEIELSADVIQVVYDGVTYSCERRVAEVGYEYGATYNNGYDFSQYPFNLWSGIEDDEWYTVIVVADGNEHTIEVYTESTVDPVWEKVGSGGSTPTEEGYEITNPVLTMNISSSTPGLSLFTTEINDDGYLSFLEKSLDDNEVISTIIIGEVYTVDEYWEYSSDVLGTENPTYSNEVNCTASGGLISITDNTKDASIDIQIGSLGKGETYENQKS